MLSRQMENFISFWSILVVSQFGVHAYHAMTDTVSDVV